MLNTWQHLLGVSYVPGTVRGSWNTKENSEETKNCCKSKAIKEKWQLKAIPELAFPFAIKDFIGTIDKNLSMVCRLDSFIVSTLICWLWSLYNGYKTKFLAFRKCILKYLVVKKHHARNLLFKLRDREREKDKASVVKCKNLRVLVEGTLEFFVLHLQLFYEVCNYERLKEKMKRKVKIGNAGFVPLKGYRESWHVPLPEESVFLCWQATREGDQLSRLAQDCPGFSTEGAASWKIL